MASTPVIDIRDIVKDFPSEAGVFRALHGVTMAVEEGEFLSIVGPSGSGKSTLMNIIGCLDSLTQGTYLFDGRDISAFADAELAHLRNRSIGFVFQQFNLLPRLTARQNVGLPLVYAGKTAAERNTKADDLLGLVGLAGKEASRPMQLSGGQQQRVAIARALANDPRLILADEPTGALDTKTGKEVLEIVRRLNRERGVTAIIVTHDPGVAAATDRVVRIHDGRITYDGPPTPEALAGAGRQLVDSPDATGTP